MNYVDDELLLITFKDGSWELRHKNNLKIWLQVRPHDRDTGAIVKAVLNHEKKCILSAGADGTMFVYKIDLPSIQRITRGDLVDNFHFEEFVGGISESSFVDPLELPEVEELDILDDSVENISPLFQ